MSTATSNTIPTGSDGASPSHGPAPLALFGPFTNVPSLEQLQQLTTVPDRRVVFRGVDWAFYDRLVESIPESSNIHVDYDGKDLEVMGKRRRHERWLRRLRKLVEVVAEELGIDYSGGGTTTWKRPEVASGLEADECYYFLPEKIAADAAALERGSDDIVDYPNPDLAIEVDLSPPQVDRAGIYATLRVAEVWRFDGRTVAIDRLMADGTYKIADASLFLPIRTEEIQRWLVDEVRGSESAWAQRLRAEIRGRKANT
jgi:Uma2 family endonuclease